MVKDFLPGDVTWDDLRVHQKKTKVPMIWMLRLWIIFVVILIVSIYYYLIMKREARISTSMPSSASQSLNIHKVNIAKRKSYKNPQSLCDVLRYQTTYSIYQPGQRLLERCSYDEK